MTCRKGFSTSIVHHYNFVKSNPLKPLNSL